MSKQNEIDFLRTMGEEGFRIALDKPFAAAECAQHFADLGILFRLLPPAPARVLDMGAGSAWTSAFYAKRGYEVVAQDIAPDMIELAQANKQRYGADSLSFICADYESLAFQDEFDCVVFYDSLHHAEDEVAALRCAYNALKRGGICITVEPGMGHSTSPGSLEAVRLYGVRERDMPPRLITAAAEKVGFSRFQLYRRPFELEELPVYERSSSAFWRRSQSFARHWQALKPWRLFRQQRRRLASAMQGSHLVVLTK